MGCAASNVPSTHIPGEKPRRFQDRYRTGTILGKGTSGVVRLAVDRITGTRYAVKIVDKKNLSDRDHDDLMREAAIMKSFRHPNIVKIIDFFEDRKNYYFVLELMRGGHLYHRMGKTPNHKYEENDAKEVVKGIAKALKYCHDHDVVHRDIKPQNILLPSTTNNVRVKLTDFGFAQYDLGSKHILRSNLGTPAYIAPEILNDVPYGKAVDMWSLGVLIFLLLGGYLPFEDSKNKTVFEKIVTADYCFKPKYWNDISDSAKSLIKGLLELDDSKRLTVEQVLSHPWLHAEDKPMDTYRPESPDHILIADDNVIDVSTDEYQSSIKTVAFIPHDLPRES